MIPSDLVIKPDPSDKTAYNKWHYSKNKPYPVRLGEFKLPLMEYANDLGHSLHHMVVKACEEYCLTHGIAFLARNKRVVAIPTKRARFMKINNKKNKIVLYCQLCLFEENVN